MLCIEDPTPPFFNKSLISQLTFFVFPAGTYDNPVYSHKQDSLGKPYFSADRFYTQNFSPDPDIHLRYLQREQSVSTDRIHR